MIEQCWICRCQNNLTGEHQIKKSDLKDRFSNGCFYLHNDKKRNIKVQSINSDKLKSPAKICAYCNNERTQSHDRAWEKLSIMLAARQKPIYSGERINLSKIFPGAVHTSMLSVHLYFVKLFGCKIVEANIPIDIQPFAKAILNNKPHANMHIAICPQLSEYVGCTNLIHALDDFTGKIVFATWYYMLCNFSVRIAFAEPNQNRAGLSNSWHPVSINKTIKIARL